MIKKLLVILFCLTIYILSMIILWHGYKIGEAVNVWVAVGWIPAVAIGVYLSMSE